MGSDDTAPHNVNLATGWMASRPSRIISMENTASTHWLRAWVDAVTKVITPASTRETEPWSSNPHPSHHTDCVVPTLMWSLST